MFTGPPGCLARRDPPQAGRAGGAQAGGIYFPRPQIKGLGPPPGRRPGGETSSPRPVWAWRISGRSGKPRMFTGPPGCLARRDPPQAGRAGGAQAGGIYFPRPQIKGLGPPPGRRPGGETSSPRPVWAWRISGRSGKPRMFTRFPGCLARRDPPQAGRAGGGTRRRRAGRGNSVPPAADKRNGAPAGPQAPWGNKQPPASLGLAYFREER